MELIVGSIAIDLDKVKSILFIDLNMEKHSTPKHSIGKQQTFEVFLIEYSFSSTGKWWENWEKLFIK